MNLKKIGISISRLLSITAVLWLYVSIFDYYSIKFLEGNIGMFISFNINIWLIIEIVYYLAKQKINIINVSNSLMIQLEALYKTEDYAAILRHRKHFSRILWIEGNPKGRVRLGEIAEDSAVKLNDRYAQISILIDDLGWTLVSMGEYDRAKNYLKHGLKLAESEGEQYWIAKAHRHLAGINLEASQIDKTLRGIAFAEKAAKEIKNEKQKNEMLAGIYYGYAVAYLKTDNPKEALKYAVKSEKLRIKGGDTSRIAKIYSLRGKIYEQLTDLNMAKDYFRKGLIAANKIGRRDEVIRNKFGLYRVYELLGKKKEALKEYNEAKELAKDTPVPFEIGEKEFKTRSLKE